MEADYVKSCPRTYEFHHRYGCIRHTSSAQAHVFGIKRRCITYTSNCFQQFPYDTWAASQVPDGVQDLGGVYQHDVKPLFSVTHCPSTNEAPMHTTFPPRYPLVTGTHSACREQQPVAGNIKVAAGGIAGRRRVNPPRPPSTYCAGKKGRGS